MPLKIALTALAATCFGCSAVKYNSHVGSDGANGYLRTYYSSAKASGRSESTGIEQCKIQGSDIICKDLNIVHADEETPKGTEPAKSASVTPAPAKIEAPAKPGKAAKKGK
ncbi:MAG: hypothetical protein J0L53_02220 [Spirochaetes bacterium]|nr:hypothetical protein [Spirochaetota bacterium]MBX3720340.1 hypothetical protein [Turneriella sp.]